MELIPDFPGCPSASSKTHCLKAETKTYSGTSDVLVRSGTSVGQTADLVTKYNLFFFLNSVNSYWTYLEIRLDLKTLEIMMGMEMWPYLGCRCHSSSAEFTHFFHLRSTMTLAKDIVVKQNTHEYKAIVLSTIMKKVAA
jgi:hypothetical protein